MTIADPLARRLIEPDARDDEIPSSLSVQSYHAALELVRKGLGFALIDPFTALMKGSRDDITCIASIRHWPCSLTAWCCATARPAYSIGRWLKDWRGLQKPRSLYLKPSVLSPKFIA